MAKEKSCKHKHSRGFSQKVQHKLLTVGIVLYMGFMSALFYHQDNLLAQIDFLENVEDHQTLMHDIIDHEDHTELKGKFRKSNTHRVKTYGKHGSKGGDSVFGGFIAGVVLISFSLPIVWMNERKQVKIAQTIVKAKKCIKKDISIEDPNEENNFELVHAKGLVSTSAPVVDSVFALEQENTIKIQRIVEVYQWRETKHTRKIDSDEEEITYKHSKEWSSTKINQNDFQGEVSDEEAKTNPEEWPCDNETFTCEAANLATFKISTSQISRMNDYQQLDIQEKVDDLIGTATGVFEEKGFAPPVFKDNAGKQYLQTYEGSPDVGDLRVRWEEVQCKNYTFIAQQIKDENDEFTFRTWNPQKVDAELDEETDQDIEACCPAVCLPCYLVELCFKTAFQETIDTVHPGSKSANWVFKQLSSANDSSTVCFRWVAWFMNVFGHYLLFTPIIKLLSWIPLVGKLLAAVLSFAVAIFALIWASTLHFAILCAAWIFYRPLYGILLGACVGLGVYVMFFVKYDIDDESPGKDIKEE